MRTIALSAAIACALGVFVIVPTRAATSGQNPATQAPFPYLPLADLPRVAATPGALDAWKTPVYLEHMPVDAAVRSPHPVVAVIKASDLANPLVQEQAFLAVSAGLGVIVVARPGEPRFDAKVFGLQGEADIVLYQPAADGTLHVMTIASGGDRDMQEAMWMQVRANALRLVAEGRKISPSPLTVKDTADPGVPPDAPRKEWHATVTGSGGRYASQHITVTRNTTASSDQKVITVKTDIGAVPFRNGLTTDTINFHRDGEAPVLFAVDSYTSTTSIAWPKGSNPDIQPLSHYPETTSQTDLDLSKYQATTTSFGVGVSPKLSAALKEKKIEPTGKLPISLSFSKTQTTEESVTMKVKDYSVAFRQAASAGRHEAAWRFPLAASIAGNSTYFDAKDTRYVSARAMTPMMREAGLQTISTWAVSGTYEGPIVISSGATIENRRFAGRNPRPHWTNVIFKPPVNHPGLPGVASDCPAIYDDGDRKPCAKGGRNLQPYSTINLDLGTPFLTRNPTVLLQSFAGPDLCLSQPYDTIARVHLERCDRRESRTTMQWQLDSASRYVNRASGKCLDANPQTGELTAADCSGALNQQWDWAADRIHSRYLDGKQRIALENGRLGVAFRHPRPAIPVNINHPLLKPWGAYPSKPHKGDFIPGFTDSAEHVPEGYLQYGPIPDGERWATIPLRAGIENSF